MPRNQDDRQAFGARLKAARTAAGLTLDGVAKRLTEDGYRTIKQTVGAWESGRNLPDPLVLKRLAKLYDHSTDALLWDSAPSLEAMQFASQYDALTERQRRTFKAVWVAFIQQGATDTEVESRMPVTQPAAAESLRRR